MFDLCEQCKKCGETTCGNDPDCGCFENNNEMKNFTVTIIETTVATSVQTYQAENEEEAEELARQDYELGMINVDDFEIDQDSGGVEYNVKKE